MVGDFRRAGTQYALEEQLNIDNQNIAQYFQNFMAARALGQRSPRRPVSNRNREPSISREWHRGFCH